VTVSGGAPRSANRIHALILDYGDVLCHPPAPGKIARMALALDMDPKTFAVRYQEERGPYDRGDLTPVEYWSRVVAGRRALDEDLVGKLRQWDVEMWSEINHDMTEWLGRVHAAGFKTALLSNMHLDMASYARRTFDWLRDLDCLILSCEVRLVKPGTEIYQRCLERLEVQPYEALFIDDREANTRAAADAGLVSLRFETVEQLRNDLAGLGFPILPLGAV
jgi:putative hydrolase of the HAD superfamily